MDARQVPVPRLTLHADGDVSPAAPRWAAVIVNYESGDLLRDCVDSVLADDSAGPVEIVVVDNGSRDTSVRVMSDAYPTVTVIAAPGNVGYARAANLGIAATRAPIVAVLNADTSLQRGAAAALVARIESQPRVGACGPRLKNTDGSDYPSARVDPSLVIAVAHGLFGGWWPSNPFTRRYRQVDADPARPRIVDWISGAAVWLPRRALDAVGGWDERYFMYLEDVDLCHRLRRAGWEVAYEPGGVVWHVQGASTRRRPVRMLVEHHRSAWRFARARFTGPRSVLLPFTAVYLAARAIFAIAARLWRSEHRERRA